MAAEIDLPQLQRLRPYLLVCGLNWYAGHLLDYVEVLNPQWKYL